MSLCALLCKRRLYCLDWQVFKVPSTQLVLLSGWVQHLDGVSLGRACVVFLLTTVISVRGSQHK